MSVHDVYMWHGILFAHVPTLQGVMYMTGIPDPKVYCTHNSAWNCKPKGFMYRQDLLYNNIVYALFLASS